MSDSGYFAVCLCIFTFWALAACVALAMGKRGEAQSIALDYGVSVRVTNAAMIMGFTFNSPNDRIELHLGDRVVKLSAKEFMDALESK